MRHLTALPQIREHLIEHQKCDASGNDDEQQTNDENDRTIATRLRRMRTPHRDLGFDNFQELFWRLFARFSFFRGSHFRFMFGANTQEKAYLAPFFTFLGVMALGGAVAHFGNGYAYWAWSTPRYWVYPLQTAVCAVLLVRYWRHYEMQWPRGIPVAFGVGILSLLLWIAPQQWFGAAPRLDGFEPAFFGAEGWPYYLNVVVRFLRLVVIVPLVEEIFWRGFLLRYLIKDEFWKVPMGSFSWLSFGLVTAGFCLEHSPPDWPAAILTGALFNFVAYRTRSLSACVLTHAVTNALLGAWVLRTGQWGFW